MTLEQLAQLDWKYKASPGSASDFCRRHGLKMQNYDSVALQSAAVRPMHLQSDYTFATESRYRKDFAGEIMQAVAEAKVDLIAQAVEQNCVAISSLKFEHQTTVKAYFRGGPYDSTQQGYCLITVLCTGEGLVHKFDREDGNVA